MALSIITIVLFFLKKQYVLFTNRFFWPFFVFFVCIFLSSIVNGTFLGAISNLLYVMISMIVAFFVINNGSTKKVFFIVFVSCLAFSSVYLLFYCLDHFLKYDSRLVSLFGNSNQLTYYFLFLELYSATNFFYFFSKKKFWTGLLLLLALFIAVVAGLLAGSKAFFVISFVSLIFFVFFYFGKDKLFISAIITSAIIILTIFLLSLPAFAYIRYKLFVFLGFVANGYEHDYSSTERFDMFKTALYLFAQKPLLGWGAHGFSNNNIFWAYSHSNLSEILCNFGLIGFFSFNNALSLPFCIITRHYNRIKKNENIFLCCVLSIMLLFGQITNVFFVIKFVFVIIGLILGTMVLFQKKHLFASAFERKDLYFKVSI